MVKICKRLNGSVWFDGINYLVMLGIIILTLYPFLYLLLVSLSPIEEIMKSTIILIPKKTTLEAYKYVLLYGSMGRAYTNTVIITLAGTLLHLILTSFGAYVLSNKYLPGRKVLTSMIIITMMFHGGMIPHYLVIKQLNLINTLWALIIPNAIASYWLIIARNFFQSIPQSLSESARIDGCSEYGILFKIVLPLSAPILATLALFHAVGQWNTYFDAVIFINSPKLQPLQVLVRSMYQTSNNIFVGDTLPPPVETVRAATVMVATLPILCIYPFLQKYFVKGMMIGAVKG